MWVKWRGDFDPGTIQIANAADVEQRSLGRENDGSWNVERWRVRGTLRGNFPLHRFPFDEQTLAIILEAPEFEARLVPDLAGSGMAESFSISDWLYEPEFRPAVSSELFRPDLGSLSFEAEPARVHRVGFEVVMARPIGPVVLKLLFPLAVLLIIVLSSLFVHPKSIPARVSMGVTGLVACIAFQFSLSGTLPDVAYMTLADALFTLVYLVSMLCIVSSVVSHGLYEKGLERAALWLDRVLRPLLVVGIIAVVWIAMPEPHPLVISDIDPLPEMERHPSSQDTLRIGSNLALHTTSGPAAVSSLWPLVDDDPYAGAQTVMVEQAPNVDRPLSYRVFRRGPSGSRGESSFYGSSSQYLATRGHSIF